MKLRYNIIPLTDLLHRYFIGILGDQCPNKFERITNSADPKSVLSDKVILLMYDFKMVFHGWYKLWIGTRVKTIAVQVASGGARHQANQNRRQFFWYLKTAMVAPS